MIPTALEKDAFPALASALTFETKSTQKSTFSRKERSDDCFYSVQRGVPQTAPSYELFRKYPRYCGSPKMNIFKEGTKRWLLLLCTRGGPPDRSFVWALSEIPPILRFTKNEHFQNKEWDHDCYYSAPGGSRRPPPHMSSLGNTPDFGVHQKWHTFK